MTLTLSTDAYDLLRDFGFTPEQTCALLSTTDTVFLVPVGAR